MIINEEDVQTELAIRALTRAGNRVFEELRSVRSLIKAERKWDAVVEKHTTECQVCDKLLKSKGKGLVVGSGQCATFDELCSLSQTAVTLIAD